MTSLPPLMTPTLTGSWKKTWLFIGLVLFGTYARSGMNAPAGTSLNTLLRTSHTEYTGPWAGTDCAPSERASTTSASNTEIWNRFVTLLPPSVRQILPRPDDVADAQQLLARLLTQRLGDQQMIVPSILGDLQHLGGGPLKQMDSVEVLIVNRTERHRRRQRSDTRFCIAETLRCSLHARPEGAELKLPQLVPQPTEGQRERRVFDVGVNRPQRVRVRLLGRCERGPRRCQ